jgi:hypothetical protein
MCKVLMTVFLPSGQTQRILGLMSCFNASTYAKTADSIEEATMLGAICDN